MATRFSVEVMTQRVSYERYADTYVDAGFSEVARRAGKLKERRLIEHVPLQDGRYRQRTRIVPEVRVPAFLGSLIPDQPIWYDEVTEYDARARSATVRIETPVGDLVSANGIARCTECDGGVLMRFEGEVDVRLPALGGIVERVIVAEVKKQYVEMSELLQRYLDGQVGRHASPGVRTPVGVSSAGRDTTSAECS